MRRVSNRKCVLGAVVFLFASGCQLSQEWASSGEGFAAATGQAAQAFAVDFARQVLAALLL
ncbi:MAG: hypothetical protein JXA69_07160 [Phycisphaerae bacterium]|nr:hypothetical protein [Phycisphaerae bacterium]